MILKFAWALYPLHIGALLAAKAAHDTGEPFNMNPILRDVDQFDTAAESAKEPRTTRIRPMAKDICVGFISGAARW